MRTDNNLRNLLRDLLRFATAFTLLIVSLMCSILGRPADHRGTTAPRVGVDTRTTHLPPAPHFSESLLQLPVSTNLALVSPARKINGKALPLPYTALLQS